jgi:hypothetical protein
MEVTTVSTTLSTPTADTISPCPLGTPWCACHADGDGEGYCVTARREVTVPHDICSEDGIRLIPEGSLTPESAAEFRGLGLLSGPVGGQFVWRSPDTFSVSAYAHTSQGETAPRIVEFGTDRHQWMLSLDEAERLATAILART